MRHGLGEVEYAQDAKGLELVPSLVDNRVVETTTTEGRQMSKSKVCRRCSKRKALEKFAVDKRRPSGHASVCKACEFDRVQAWRDRSPKNAAYQRRLNREWMARYREQQRAKAQRGRAA